MIEELFQIGIAQGLGVFFFLFVALGALFWSTIRWVMAENRKREQRYLDTIDGLTEAVGDVRGLKGCLNELRNENKIAHTETKSMIGRVLDRLPIQRLHGGGGSE